MLNRQSGPPLENSVAGVPLPLAFLAHELRAPLTTLHGAAMTLLRRRSTLDPSVQDRLLYDLAVEAERLARLVDGLLELCRPDGGAPSLREPVALRPLVSRVLRVMRPALSQHRVARRLPAGLPPVEADPIAVEHILRNLLDNAARYAPPGSLVTVSGGYDGQCVRLRVSDRGPGIAPGVRDRVFAPYVRLESGWSRGSGLGLAICRRMAEGQGGSIELESRRGGPGLAVVVALPVARE